MKPSQIPPIDDLLGGKGNPIGPDADATAVGAVQDLLRGHGFSKMPGPGDAGRGQFGPATTKALADFRAAHGLPPGETVDQAALRQLIEVPAVAPVASQAYITLVLDIDFDPLVKLVVLVAAVEGAGKFAALNLNTDKAGLSVGIIQWAQKPKRLNELLTAFQTARSATLNALFGADKVTGVLGHTAKLNGGVNPVDGATTDTRFDLIKEPWKSRFRAACLDPSLQAVQVTAARAAFDKSSKAILTNMPKLTSERSIAFALDLANQFGDAGAKKLYDQAELGLTDQKALLVKMRDLSVAKLTELFPKLPQAAQAGADRRNFFLSTGLLADSVFKAAAGGVGDPPPPSTANPRRYFLPDDDAQGLRHPMAGTKATPFIHGSNALPAMRDAIARATAEGDFIYLANWHCEVDLPLVSGDPSSTLRALLTKAAAAKVQIRGMFWAGISLPPLPLFAPILVDPFSGSETLIAYELLRNYIDSFAPEGKVNRETSDFIEGLKSTGDAASILDNRHLFAGSHHQKILVVRAGGDLTAFVGGIEVNRDRLPPPLPKTKGSPLFDLSVRLEDASAWLAMDTFVRRWKLHPSAHGTPLLGDSQAIPVPVGGPLTVQMTHTYGNKFPFPFPVQTASTALANGIRNARQFIYMEDQYFVGSPNMDSAFRDALNPATGPNVMAIIVIAAEDSVSDLPDLPFRRRAFLGPLAAAFPGRFLIFERLGGGSTTGPTAYVHSKFLIVDDEAALIGSVNSSRRSWFHDSEVDGTIVDTQNGAGGITPGTRGWVRDYRCQIWAEHFLRSSTTLGNPVPDLAIWKGINDGTITGTSVQPYNVTATPPRPSVKGVPVPIKLLDWFWDTFADPPA